MLKQKLGIANKAQNPEPAALDSIRAFFTAPLQPSKQEALQALFSDGLDPMAMALDLTGFEHDAP